MLTYVTGYGGRVRTRGELELWSQWQGLDPEHARRALALMDASIVAGQPLGIGGTIRTVQGQEDLFYSRHHVAAPGEHACCVYQGVRYALNAGAAHAAPPGDSYHEPVTPQGKCLAIDWVGNLRFLKAHCAEYGLNEFSGVNREPWHSQPAELPRGRSRYNAATMHPLAVIALPGLPAPAPQHVEAPTPVLRIRTDPNGPQNDRAEVRELQAMCNFWRWRDALGRDLIVDGDYGAKTTQAVRTLQRALNVTVDGVYGPQTASALQRFLDDMAAMTGSPTA